MSEEFQEMSDRKVAALVIGVVVAVVAVLVGWAVLLWSASPDVEQPLAVRTEGDVAELRIPFKGQRFGVLQRCLGIVGYTKSEGDGGGLNSPVVLDPYCLGVYDANGKIDAQQLDRWIAYQAAISSGNTEAAQSAAHELINNAPSDK